MTKCDTSGEMEVGNFVSKERTKSFSLASKIAVKHGKIQPYELGGKNVSDKIKKRIIVAVNSV